MSDELGRIKDILAANSEKEFVKRILDPENSPSIDMGGGFRGTHFMAAELDTETGKWMVFPTIVRMLDGELKRLDPNQAMLHAKDTGQFIDFADKAEDAVWFSKSYKKVWEKDGDGDQ